MSSLTYLDDYKDAVGVINGEVSGFFKTIFYCSNEDLPTLFRDFDFSGKKVLCVNASSDQYFHCLNHGATDVDLFDVNKLTIHYFYLRKWILKYFDMYYPEYKELTNSNVFLRNVLSHVKCSSEDELNSYNFWMLFLDTRDFDISNLFNRPATNKKNIITDTCKLVGLLDASKPNFFHFNLCEENDIPMTKYDVVYASNILEHCGLDNRRLKLCKQNLSHLLNDDGIVINSYLYTTDFDLPRVNERKIFSDEFSCEQILANYTENSTYPVGYTYKKKK